jgi:putative transposase
LWQLSIPAKTRTKFEEITSIIRVDNRRITYRIFRAFRISGFLKLRRIEAISEDDGLEAMGQVTQIDEARIRDHFVQMIRRTVEETLKALLDAEADRLCGAGRYERARGRQDTRAGSYERSLRTVAGEANLKVPKLRRQTLETERYRRREESLEEALIEMYLAGISARRVEDITEAASGHPCQPEHGVEPEPEDLRQDRGLEEPADRGRCHEAQLGRNVSLPAASAFNSGGFRDIVGAARAPRRTNPASRHFCANLVDRCPKGLQPVISDACRGLFESVADFLPEARYQHCMVHFSRL